MSVRNAGAAIREARLKEGLSHEKLSDGICSALSLSRIENGTAGVSPSTFQALMAHAGAPCEVFPIFANRRDFDCFYTLKRVRFYLDCWQLDQAYNELEKIEYMNFAENKYYYQEWLLLHCKLQFRSGCGVHSQIYQTLLDTLHISRPEIDFSDFRELLLSLNEIELLTAVAQEALYLNDLDTCLEICSQISFYLENSQIFFLEKERLLAENAMVYTKYLIVTQDYHTALKIVDKHRHRMVEITDNSNIHELTFLVSVAYYFQNNYEKALLFFKTAFFSSYSIESCYATICRNYMYSSLHFPLSDEVLAIPDIPLIYYKIKEAIDISDFTDGTYDLFSPDTLTIGGLIRELRIEQGISQETLCQGLCGKSKLSKIENGIQQPSVILAETLLQRLGISDTVFSFFGDEREYNLNQLKVYLAKTSLTNSERIKTYITEMQALLTDSDHLYYQYLLCHQASIEQESSKHFDKLQKSLMQTISDFNFNSICQHSLSWTELSILNSIARHHSYSDTPAAGILDFYKIIEYFSYTAPDILAQKRVFPITLQMLVLQLYRQKRYAEILEISHMYSDNSLKYSLRVIAHIHAHYCQALAECKDFHRVRHYAIYTYYNFMITESFSKAEQFCVEFPQDYGIDLI